MKDKDIVKALECCGNSLSCVENQCPMLNYCGKDIDSLEKYALDLINRQKAEIERLQKHIQEGIDLAKQIPEMVALAQAEAIKEFAAKIKEDARWICDDSYIEDALTKYVDNFVKEKVGDDNSPIVDKQN